MQGLLADVNCHGEIAYLQRLLVRLDLWIYLEELSLSFRTFAEVGLVDDLSDRDVWNYCQANGWMLLTDNRNDDSADSLQATLDEAWQMGMLPILTISSKPRFQTDLAYAEDAAADIAELLYGMKVEQRHRDQPRIFVPMFRDART